MNAKLFIKLLIAAAEEQIEQHGEKAHEFVERMATLPEKDIRRACQTMKMTEEQTVTAVKLFRRLADAADDATVFLASGGRIQPD